MPWMTSLHSSTPSRLCTTKFMSPSFGLLVMFRMCVSLAHLGSVPYPYTNRNRECDMARKLVIDTDPGGIEVFFLV